MKILHTSDWHLGQNFNTRSRESEHEKFFDWLIKTIEDESIDILIVAGDIFDSANPPKYALTMYHVLLTKVIKTSCKDVVIIAGNHDSIATIEMTKTLGKFLNIHIVASGEDIEETIIQIKVNGKLKAIVCAVPFLRDKILRDASVVKNNKQREEEYQINIKKYYNDIFQKAKEISRYVPLIATGHFTASGATFNPESERELYIGNLQRVDNDMLKQFDYVALGHLHSAQKVTSYDHIRYSGSPIPLSFSEAGQTKKVIIVEFNDNNVRNIKEIDIPIFRAMYKIKGSIEKIQSKIDEYKDADNKPFVEISIEDDILDFDKKEFEVKAYEMGIEIISMRKDTIEKDIVLQDIDEDIELSQLDNKIIFEKRLDLEKELKDNKELKDKLIANYNTILQEIDNENN